MPEGGHAGEVPGHRTQGASERNEWGDGSDLHFPTLLSLLFIKVHSLSAAGVKRICSAIIAGAIKSLPKMMEPGERKT